ncbi:MAG: endolytic transglycosylase MltG [Desulfocapsaceae bacterium]|nr:endolytic transglycosylase MltG [Desulfocapsaceae bacterium]
MTGTQEEKPGNLYHRSRVALWVTLGLFVCFLLSAAWFSHYALRPGPYIDEDLVTVFIPPGTSVKDISRLLAEKKLVYHDFRFLLLVRLMGKSARLQAGEFQLKTNQSPADLIIELAHARPLEHRVTLPEGLNIVEIADIFTAGDWVDRQRFIDLARDSMFIERLGLVGIDSLEGYLFPDTYRLVKPSKGEEGIIAMLVTRSLSIWQQLADENSSGLDRHQVFTLASMIEKETGAAGERPIIASVFFNRLKKKMKLQSDPTVIYGVSNFNGPLSRSDLKRATPYNTYIIPALPPGPICNPGAQALEAVLFPADTEYLYFVSKNDGTHHFSTSLQEHNRAVRKYQRGRKEKAAQ